jgi:hypothetical protein
MKKYLLTALLFLPLHTVLSSPIARQRAEDWRAGYDFKALAAAADFLSIYGCWVAKTRNPGTRSRRRLKENNER